MSTPGVSNQINALRARDDQQRMDFWHLCDELSVLQAAALLVGVDPSCEDGAHCDSWPPEQQPAGYLAAKSALIHAILSGRLIATVRRSVWERGWDEEPGEGEGYARVAAMIIERDLKDMKEISQRGRDISKRGVIYRAQPDWSLTTVPVEALQQWLAGRGFRTGFFFPEAADAPDYLDPKHPRYAPKLAAAVKAWLSVADPKGKSPKQALVKWLREHGAEFDLSDEEGRPNEQGIEECAKVANWQLAGGAPKTPGA